MAAARAEWGMRALRRSAPSARGSAGTPLGFEALLLADRRGRQSRLATSLIAGSRAALSKTRGRGIAGRVGRRAPMAPRAGREVDRAAKRFDGKVRPACAAEPRWRLDRRRHERGSNPGSGINEVPANDAVLVLNGGQLVANSPRTKTAGAAPGTEQSAVRRLPQPGNKRPAGAVDGR